MKITLKINQAGEKRYLLHLIAQLKKHIEKAEVSLSYKEEGVDSPALSSLLMLEKVLLRKNQLCGADRLSKADLSLPEIDENGSIVIDLTDEATIHQKGFAPAFDGGFGFENLAAQLLEGRNPEIAIVDLEKGHAVTQGKASLEAANGIGGAIEAIYSRVIILLIKAIKTENQKTAVPSKGVHSEISYQKVTPYILKSLARHAIKQIYHLCCYPSHWRIGWRFVESDGVMEKQNLKGTPWQVLDHPVDHFYADPFPFVHQGKNYLFFEDLDHHHGKGVISYVSFDENGPTQKAEVVLEESTHLSYPFLIEHQGEIFMLPENSLSGEVSLYRATRFPDKWEKHATLLGGVEAADATLIEYHGKWWLFAVLREGMGGYSDCLVLYSSDSLFGPYKPHPQNPVIVDPETARPAGNMVISKGNLWRPVQNCRPSYGAGLSLAKITRLDEEGFEQEIINTLYPEKSLWPGRKLHTLNRVGNLEVIDGCIYRPKLPALAKLADKYYQPT